MYAVSYVTQQRMMSETMTSTINGVTWVEYFPEWFFQSLAFLVVVTLVGSIISVARFFGRQYPSLNQIASWKTSLVSIFLLNVLFLGTSHVLSYPPFPFYQTFNAAIAGLYTFFGMGLQEFYDFSSLLLVVLLAVSVLARFRHAGAKAGALAVSQVLSLAILPLGLEIYAFDPSEWNLHVAQVQTTYNLLPWLTNADLFYSVVALLVASTLIRSLGLCRGLNPVRDRRLWEVRRRLHTKNLDIGSGDFPITRESVTLDVQECKHPMVRQDILDGIPFPEASFDSVTALEFLEHFKEANQVKILGEVHRVLEKGGQLIVSIPYSWGPMKIVQSILWFVRSRTTIREYYKNTKTNGHIGLMTPSSLEAMVKHVGFKIIESRRLLFYDYIVVAVKS